MQLTIVDVYNRHILNVWLVIKMYFLKNYLEMLCLHLYFQLTCQDVTYVCACVHV
jgi:hypothetical protein